MGIRKEGRKAWDTQVDEASWVRAGTYKEDTCRGVVDSWDGSWGSSLYFQGILVFRVHILNFFLGKIKLTVDLFDIMFVCLILSSFIVIILSVLMLVVSFVIFLVVGSI